MNLRQAGELANKAASVKWVKWVHPNTEAHSNLLKAEIEKQAYNVYLSGEYILGKMNSYGQRIDIPITLNCKNGQKVTFKTGWMTYPNGKIILITPYGGKIK